MYKFEDGSVFDSRKKKTITFTDSSGVERQMKMGICAHTKESSVNFADEEFGIESEGDIRKIKMRTLGRLSKGIQQLVTPSFLCECELFISHVQDDDPYKVTLKDSPRFEEICRDLKNALERCFKEKCCLLYTSPSPRDRG